MSGLLRFDACDEEFLRLRVYLILSSSLPVALNMLLLLPNDECSEGLLLVSDCAIIETFCLLVKVASSCIFDASCIGL